MHAQGDCRLRGTRVARAAAWAGATRKAINNKQGTAAARCWKSGTVQMQADQACTAPELRHARKHLQQSGAGARARPAGGVPEHGPTKRGRSCTRAPKRVTKSRRARASRLPPSSGTLQEWRLGVSRRLLSKGWRSSPLDHALPAGRRSQGPGPPPAPSDQPLRRHTRRTHPFITSERWARSDARRASNKAGAAPHRVRRA